MVKSKINTYGFWVAPIIFFIVSVFSISILYYSQDDKDILPVTFTWILISVLLIPTLIRLHIFTISPSERIISVKNLFTRTKVIYQFSYFEGYVTMTINPARGRAYDTIYLVKDGRFVLEISSNVYSNFFELKSALKEMSYLGDQKSSFYKHFKILFRKKVL